MRRFAAALIVAAFVIAPFVSAQEKKPLKALLVIGGCCHDYEKQKDILAKGIAERANVEVTIAYDPDKSTKHLNPVYEKADWYKGFDVIIHDECSADVKDEAVIENILKPHKEGVPGMLLHCGMHCYRSKGYPKMTPWFEFTGLPSTGHGPQQPIQVTYVDKAHPIAKGLEDWTTIKEELYNNVAGGVLESGKVLARGKQTVKGKDGKEKTEDNVVTWVNTYAGKTKVFATTLGHNNETVADPRYLDLVTRGLLWVTGNLGEDGKPAAGYGPKK